MAGLPENFEIRLLEPADSISELTALINRAYSQLAEMGLKYVGTWQGEDMTRKRLKDVECYIGVSNAQIISTIALRPPGRGKGSPWYLSKDVAIFGQFGVLLEYRRRGIGTVMVRHCEDRARQLGAKELACDTAEPATHLIDWYKRLGYRFIEYVDWEITNYRSVILSKTL